MYIHKRDAMRTLLSGTEFANCSDACVVVYYIEVGGRVSVVHVCWTGDKTGLLSGIINVQMFVCVIFIICCVQYIVAR